ncbi:MAG: hypothetical protein JSW11_00860 [Candidatus Heimdallarchaeota archaeon]|nr:MAG: hypothetical protein JSW11_00860 [Candidatus Heimdallarchaeota archaeon]
MGRFLFNQERTTNLEAVLLAIPNLLESIVIILTLGFWRPSWGFGAAVKLMELKFPDDE